MTQQTQAAPFNGSDFSHGATKVVRGLQDAGFTAYVVGGAVRYLLLGQRPKDFDVATNATPEQIRQCFRNARIIGRRFQIVHVRSGGEIIEVTTFRGNHAAAQAGQHSKASESGRLLRDNVYGTLEEDALRRDLTINALYYDTSSNTLIDQLNGAADIEARMIRVIGVPEERYREDPVRMLRVLRFSARLQFDLAADTETAIASTRLMLGDIPSARLFDEWLKLFMNGFSAPTFTLLKHHDLIALLMGDNVGEALHKEQSASLQMRAMRNTDQRVADRRPVTPAFLLAALYWPAVEQLALRLEEEGEPTTQAIHSAGQQVVHNACQHLTIPKRFSLAMRDIWDLQPRLERMQPKKITDLLARRWFRAAFDLRLLREEAGNLGSQCSDFWTAQQKEHPDLVGSARPRRDDQPKRRRRPRGNVRAP